jgi:hypothetical protein
VEVKDVLNSKLGLVIPLAMVAIGGGALLTTLKIMPGFDWVLPISLAMVGIAFPLSIGFDKVTFVACMVFLAIAVMSVMRQLSIISTSVEIPGLVIWIGIVLLVARMPVIPNPTWMENPQNPKE